MSTKTLTYGSTDFFSVVGLAWGITAADKQYFADHPDQSERWRPYVAGELEHDPPDATDVYIYELRFFDGTRTGLRHRMVLRRAERHRY